MRTLVIHIGAIGDFLLCCPTLPALRRDGPVELLGNRERLQTAVDGGLADAAHDADRHDFGSVFSTPSPKLRAFLRQFDRCVAWTRPDNKLLENLRACDIPEVHAYPGLPPANWTDHASAYYLQCLSVKDPGPPRLVFHAPSRHDDIDIVIHPGSGGEHKNWLLENFKALAAELARQGRRVTWCTGPAEEKMPPLHPQLTPMPLTNLARTLANAKLYIGNDSGITHLAAAVNCPTIAVFGPTNPAIWAPRGKNVIPLRGANGSFPTVQQVLGEIS